MARTKTTKLKRPYCQQKQTLGVIYLTKTKLNLDLKLWNIFKISIFQILFKTKNLLNPTIFTSPFQTTAHPYPITFSKNNSYEPKYKMKFHMKFYLVFHVSGIKFSLSKQILYSFRSFNYPANES